MFYIKLTSLSDFYLVEGLISPTGQFKQCLDSFYVTDSPLTLSQPSFNTSIRLMCIYMGFLY